MSNLQLVRDCVTHHKDKRSFMAVVARHSSPDDVRFKQIERAYDIAEEEFRGKFRDSGEDYFDHLRAVALILMVYLRVYDTSAIVAALLHDIIENIPGWDYHRVHDTFGVGVAEIVWYVTKPPKAEFIGDRETRNRRYHQNLLNATRLAIVVKLADLLHNLLTLSGVTEEKRLRKIKETKDFYLILAEKECILIHELEAVLDELQDESTSAGEKIEVRIL